MGSPMQVWGSRLRAVVWKGLGRLGYLTQAGLNGGGKSRPWPCSKAGPGEGVHSQRVQLAC